MQSLANRHTDRSRRKAMNRTEFNGATAVSVGTVALAYRQFALLRSRMEADNTNENAVKELDLAIDGIDAEIAGGFRSLAEAPDGSGDTMAGIGVVNSNVVPMAALATSDDGKGASTGNDPAWGDVKPVTVEPLEKAEPVDGNINGAALAEQLGDPSGWGTETPSTPTPEDANSGNGGGTK